MQFSILKAAAFAVAFQTTSAAPTTSRSGGRHNVVATTTNSNGQIVDWVLPESQNGAGGKIATPPPSPPKKLGQRDNTAAIRSLLAANAETKGPNGTVPILRSSGEKPKKRLPSKKDNGGLVNIAAAADDENYQGVHWYASSGQSVDNHGGKATVSLFKAFVENGADFSLLQTAVVRNNAAHAGGAAVSQTVECGWINYPNQIEAPHLFAYYTTNGYATDADNQGGWNTDVAGWVQVDADLFPGVAITSLSTDGGDQYEMEIGYYLSEGNWWLWCMDRYIGYYPASLFSQGVNAADTLADHADVIDWYGEIYNSETAMTTTDMGSGEFPDTGFGKSAYMHNILYVDTNNNYIDYDGSSQLVVSDTARYNILPTWNSGSSWGSYFYLGGPGAGGQIGA
ncbi:hypothetical protein F4808DRAFT_76656 [Astrocystis sublimbata]|nr:hypothetical protein F4808DRAFT_76656 [Astrocystis sublimbata]